MRTTTRARPAGAPRDNKQTDALEDVRSRAVAEVVGPHIVHVGAHAVRVGDGWAATLIVTGYPATVGLAWLEPVLSALTPPARVTTAIHIDPLPQAAAAAGLRRSRARLEASRRLDADHGRLVDPTTEVTAGDAETLAHRLVSGEVRLFRVGVYLTVHAPTREELQEAVAQVRAAAASAMLDTQPATWRQLAGWTSTLPLGHDGLRQTRVMDTDALALAFPLASQDLPAPLPGRPDPSGGVLIGTNPTTGGIVWWDRWSLDNHNGLVLARSGAGKSYLVKLDILRNLYDGVQVAVIDPEDEYPPLADAVGGTTLALGRPGVRVNPLDLPPGDRRPDALRRRILFLHTLVGVLLGQPLDADQVDALDGAAGGTYAAAGITHDPGTWSRPAPLLADLVTTLEQRGDAGKAVAVRLRPWTHGSFNSLFDGPTTARAAGPLVVWSVRQLPDELRAAGMLLALDAIWRGIDTPTQVGPEHEGRRRLVVVDEAWMLLRDTAGARFLYRMAKAARKRSAGLVVVTQDAADLLASELGQAVAANAATQILMRQAPQAIDAVAAAFGLTSGEARSLLALPRGHGLLLGGTHRVAFHALASPAEHTLCQGLEQLPRPTSQRRPGSEHVSRTAGPRETP